MEVIISAFLSAIIFYVAGVRYGSKKAKEIKADWIKSFDGSRDKPRILAFGHGDFTVEVGNLSSSGPHRTPAVFICPSDKRGNVGELAMPTKGEDRFRLAKGEIAMMFKTDKQAFDVAEAICGYRPKKIN